MFGSDLVRDEQLKGVAMQSPRKGLAKRKRRAISSTTVCIKEDLGIRGFSCLKGAQLELPSSLIKDLEIFRTAYNDLPVDPYCEGGCRRRRLSRFVLLPWSLLLAPRPTSNYFQSPELNPKDGGIVRSFASLGKLESNRFLRELILFDFINTTFPEQLWANPIDVGVHAIRIVARPGQPGVSSPDCLHKDGEPFTFIHLMDRRDVVGGENLITDNNYNPLLRATLMNCLDTIAVSDQDVYHHVNRIEVAPGKSEGYRDVLLIDFTPMSPIPLSPGMA